MKEEELREKREERRDLIKYQGASDCIKRGGVKEQLNKSKGQDLMGQSNRRSDRMHLLVQEETSTNCTAKFLMQNNWVMWSLRIRAPEYEVREYKKYGVDGAMLYQSRFEPIITPIFYLPNVQLVIAVFY